MIEVTNLTKAYGETLAVDDLTFTVRPGIVTGFLGPNGAGKSTTMRMILGLDAPTSGTATVDGRPLAEHPIPLRSMGALLEAKAVHPSRSAYDHLRALAATSGIGIDRVDEVLDIVGLGGVARRGSGGFSLGMGQRPILHQPAAKRLQHLRDNHGPLPPRDIAIHFHPAHPA